jgi:hypothetical protein
LLLDVHWVHEFCSSDAAVAATALVVQHASDFFRKQQYQVHAIDCYKLLWLLPAYCTLSQTLSALVLQPTSQHLPASHLTLQSGFSHAGQPRKATRAA